MRKMGARWLSGRVSDSGARGPGSRLPPPCCVLEQDTLLPESTGLLPRKRWLRHDMTEKLLTGTLSLNTTSHEKKDHSVMHSNTHSCIDTYAHSCLKPLSNERKLCSDNQIHVQIMKFACCLNMVFLENRESRTKMIKDLGLFA